ncbi:MAG: putative metal-binding motif-containing protein [Sandaracinaceae bacterium]|nr:putative metal-binding motif-containing protein [Sandaracinaceae bacterium]
MDIPKARTAMTRTRAAFRIIRSAATPSTTTATGNARPRRGWGWRGGHGVLQPAAERRPPVCGTDCNDAAPAVKPSAMEICNGVDEDCDGVIDDGVQTTYTVDADGDGYGSNAPEAMTTLGCVPALGYAPTADDCNDTPGWVAASTLPASRSAIRRCATRTAMAPSTKAAVVRRSALLSHVVARVARRLVR